jgi:hypothetical protein
MRNVLPSEAVLGRYPFLRGAIPAPVLAGQGFSLTRVQDPLRVEQALNRPGVLGPPAGLPAISQTIPRFTPTLTGGAVGPEDLGRIRGMGLPRQAVRPLTPFMRQQIRVHRQLQGPFRIETRPAFRPLARPETAPQVEVIRGVTSRKITPSGPEGFQAAAGATTPPVIRGAGSRRLHPTGFGGLPAAPSREFRQPAGGAVRAGSPRKFRQTSGFRATVPREFRAAPAPVFRSEPRATFSTRPSGPSGRGAAPARNFAPPAHGR